MDAELCDFDRDEDDDPDNDGCYSEHYEKIQCVNLEIKCRFFWNDITVMFALMEMILPARYLEYHKWILLDSRSRVMFQMFWFGSYLLDSYTPH